MRPSGRPYAAVLRLAESRHGGVALRFCVPGCAVVTSVIRESCWTGSTAIDCAVVEALEQFRRGADETPCRKGKEFFRDFLTQTRFGRHFTPATANVFYETIRCGILHQAETKADSLVKKKAAAFVVKQSATGKGLIINARSFHSELEAVLDDYAAALLAGDVVLRTAFIRKMKYVARDPTGIAGVV